MTNPKSLSQERFGRYAQRYVNSQEHATKEDLDILVDLAEPQPSWVMLDVATGGGHTALRFAPLVGQVVASDLTPSMLEAAQTFITGQGVTNVRFRLADAETLPFRDGQFDLVTCRIAPHHFPNVDHFVAEAYRVLAPGGRLIVQDQIVPEDPSDARFVNHFERLRDPSHHWAYSASDWERYFVEADLQILRQATLTKPHNLQAWAQRQDGTPETIARLEALLLEASPGVTTWLRPRALGTPQAAFDNRHLLIAGRKPTDR